MANAYPQGDTAAGTRLGRERLGGPTPVWDGLSTIETEARYVNRYWRWACLDELDNQAWTLLACTCGAAQVGAGKTRSQPVLRLPREKYLP